MFLLAAGAACKSAANLEPAPSAARPPVGTPAAGLESAIDRVEGVEVVASAEPWVGPAQIRYEITPVRVRLVNESLTPIRIDYGQFWLTGTEDDEVYRAIAPFAIEGEAEQKRLIPDPSPLEPAWYGERYFVYDPFARYYYGGVGTYADPYIWSDADWAYYDAFWQDRQLPTPAMLARALPPGVVEPGGSVEGWLYFEKVDPEAEGVHFRARIVNAQTGRPLGVARMPFEAEED